MFCRDMENIQRQTKLFADDFGARPLDLHRLFQRLNRLVSSVSAGDLLANDLRVLLQQDDAAQIERRKYVRLDFGELTSVVAQ